MDLALFGGLIGIGLLGGFMAGFLGIGGAIIIIPLLLYGVPALLPSTHSAMTMNLATGISMVQAFFATLSGLVVHRRNRTLDLKLGLALGVTGVVGALAGSFGSAHVASRTLLSIYLGLIAVALLLLFAAPRAEKAKAEVNLALALPIGLGVGVLGGLLGVGGGFVIIPLMIAVLRVPTRIAVGTSLLVVLMTTLAGAMGKIATGQFDLQTATFVILGSIVGAQLGGRLNSRVSAKTLRASLTLLLIAIGFRTGMDLI